jgi:hypothetical protein
VGGLIEPQDATADNRAVGMANALAGQWLNHAAWLPIFKLTFCGSMPIDRE